MCSHVPVLLVSSNNEVGKEKGYLSTRSRVLAQTVYKARCSPLVSQTDLSIDSIQQECLTSQSLTYQTANTSR